MKFVFLSHVDSNLYRFRLPVMQALVRKGHEVIALCPEGKDFHRFAQHKIQAQSYFINRRSKNPVLELKTLWELTRILCRIRPDILHTFTIKPNLYGCLAGRLARCPHIYCAVTGLGSLFLEKTQHRLKTRLLHALLRILRLADGVVFQNADDLQAFTKDWSLIAAQKAHLIRSSGVDTQYFHPEALSPEDVVRLKTELHLRAEQPVVLMVARAIWDKGLAEYAHSAQQLHEQLPQAVFLLAGDVDTGNPSAASREWLQRQKNLSWLGERNDIRSLIALADLCVLPSYREGVPRTLLEAAAMGKPIVTTNVPGCREVVQHEKNGLLVPVRDSKALAESILQLLQDPARRQSMGRAGRAKAVQEFAVHYVVAQYLDLYGVLT